MAAYVVVADRLAYRSDGDESGKINRVFRGAVIDDLADADVARFARAGAIAAKQDDAAKAAVEAPLEANPAETSDAVDVGGPVGHDGDPAPSAVVAVANGAPVRPLDAATVKLWREYVVAKGHLTAEQASKVSKDDLIDAYGQ